MWVCESPYGKMHKRKNCYLSGAAFAPPKVVPESGEFPYEATRASGPGGQHVNKTDSAIRATHVASGLSLRVQSERSQHANKRLAGQLLASKLAERAKAAEEKTKASVICGITKRNVEMPHVSSPGPVSSSACRRLSAQQLQQVLGVERGPDLDVIIEIIKNIAAAAFRGRLRRDAPGVAGFGASPPGGYARGPAPQRFFGMAAGIQFLVAMQAQIHEIGRRVLAIRPFSSRVRHHQGHPVFAQQ